MLQKLTVESLKNIADRKICCIEYSASYLKELCESFEVLDHIECIIDENIRNQGFHELAGRNLEVRRAECIQNMDMEKTVFIITSDYSMEAYERLEGLLPQGSIQPVVFYFENQETAIEMEYRRRYEGKKLENIIIFRSGPHASTYIKGMDFADNARALFAYMLDNHFNEKYRLVWLVEDPSEFTRYDNVKNVDFLSFHWSVSEDESERDAYYEALCLAKYIFFTDAYGFARNCRPDQIRVQLWHGCGFKTRVNFVRCEKRYEYTTVISEVYAGIHQDIYGLRQDQILITGYAKQDWLFHPARNACGEMGIPAAGKYIFWLPTFRTTGAGMQNLNEYEFHNQTGLPVVDTYSKLEELDRLLQDLDIVLVLKLHPFQDREKAGRVRGENIILLDNGQLADKDLQINQLLGYADALISDYSSAAVDYMLLDRPIGFTLDDVEEYAQSRGFVFENIKEWLPGKELFSFEEFCLFCREIGEGIDSSKEKRSELKSKMHQYQDDNNCRRIVEGLNIQIEKRKL